ncbi:MBL fold metallo-hydrolase [Halococcus hamelinensis]|uniref:Fused rhodanese domain-containing protein/hydrolase n=1 Tax=Halococcus hamelinensis 100A6 TaxID=1132509 RepID=M0LY28_9EURY|nr:MBL fold metallo-hydrolase [Halococcus hamelinensis]EMA38361.1 fused rhodanese domain-containing protein/hydrolase [Halococcus hamelinensis 100A6]
MSENGISEPDAEVESIEPDELKDRIDRGEEVVLLDTRASDAFEAWHIDGPNVTTYNVPYFEFLFDDVPEARLDGIPDDRPVTVLCAKGDSSEYVAGALQERGYEVTHLARGMNGWAELYEYHELDVGADVTVAQYQRPSSGCLAYLVVSGDEAAVIDPLRAFTDTYRQDARALGAEVAYALDTHVHADHVSGVRRVARENDADAIVPQPAAERGIDFETPYTTIEDGEAVPVGETEIEAIHAPGHTTGTTAYRVGDVLFTGDSLFTESVARPDLEAGAEGAAEAAADLHGTLQNTILPLPEDTVVAPGHFGEHAETVDGTYVARLGDLEARMEALRMDRESFVAFVRSDMPPRPNNHERIVAINLGERDADDREAFELEQGPNNCAASQNTLTSD